MKVTINGVDCYGTLNGSNNVEVICGNCDGFIVDASGFTSWRKLVRTLKKQYFGITELVAD